MEEQMQLLQDKLKRTTKFLKEIQTLSSKCEDVQFEDARDKQVRELDY